MYIEFRGGPMDGRRMFLPVVTETIVHTNPSGVAYHYLKAPRENDDHRIYQYVGVLELVAA